jgi:hypothetical protein
LKQAGQFKFSGISYFSHLRASFYILLIKDPVQLLFYVFPILNFDDVIFFRFVMPREKRIFSIKDFIMIVPIAVIYTSLSLAYSDLSFRSDIKCVGRLQINI